MLVFPRKVNLSFNAAPSGLTLNLDGIAKTTPFVYDTLVGFNHTIEAPNQTSGATSYTFASWSDGGAQTHTLVVPATDQSYLATFQAAAGPSTIASYAFNEATGTTARPTRPGNGLTGDAHERGHLGRRVASGAPCSSTARTTSSISAIPPGCS